MSDSEFSDRKILRSWEVNAAPWIEAIDRGSIASRKLVTDAAIVDATLALQPRSVLDIGCGEGWLARQLATGGVRVLGVDAIAQLIEVAQARAGKRETYRQLSYAQLAAGELDDRFDLLVCNFSLLGRECVEELIAAAPALLNPAGSLVIQTLHPRTLSTPESYFDGWRHGTWDGFSGDFQDPAPWYFRTIESWQALLHNTGFAEVSLQEPLHPHTGQPASLILTAAIK